MASRPLMIAALVGASVGVPYVVSETRKGTWSFAGGESATAASAQPAAPGMIAPEEVQMPTASAGLPFHASPLPRDGMQVHAIEQVFRFDLTKDWVYRNWPRKSTGPTDVGLQSVRVPLVTGTQIPDLAGALTYFFNAQGQVEHISFRGRTGDARRLVEFLMRTYEFRQENAPPGEEHYRVRRTGRPQSELRVRPEAVLQSTAPHGSYTVELELARPGSRRLLPPRDTSLAIPPVAATPVEVGVGADANTGQAEPSNGSFLDKVRFATPEEQSQLNRMRWPN